MSKRKTKEQFIEEAKLIHGNKYDYSEVEYINTNTKVCIVCPQHGEFWQTPKKHLQGQGCPKCSGKNKTTEDFIKKASLIHNNKYDYSKSTYVNSKTPINIICPIHGEFQQTPDSHVNGKQGCPKCANKNVTTEEFIEKAQKIHGNKYNYSKVNYINSSTIIDIICFKHGEFKQTPNIHLSGCGCPKCGNEKIKNVRQYTTEQFIIKAKKIFPQYDYSKVNYIDSQTKVIIICPEHGEFEILPSSLLRGHGCIKCSRKYNDKNDYIKAAQKIHGDKYDYSKLVWKDSQTKVEIICSEHGSFWKDPYKHLMGEGCPICSKLNRIQTTNSKGEDLIEDWLINNKIQFSHNKTCIKINNLNIYPDFVVGNIIIEYNGIQHYEYNKHFHKNNILNFEKQQYRDRILREYCKENNITLIEIRYDQNIYEELEKIKSIL